VDEGAETEMTNADKFKHLFGIYATELWSMPEKDFLEWINSEAMNSSEIPNNSDTIYRQAAIDALDKRFDFVPMEQTTEILLLRKDLRELPTVQPKKRTETHARDCISRQAAIRIASGYCHPANIAKELEHLPSVQPERKTAHWIEIAQYSDGKHKIECSECGNHIFDRGHANSFNVKNKYKYCPNCGAKMVEPQESEEKQNEDL
jgi:Pyruvate/2-oxoacid:ferredoxin oxidoreductase delta subunit